MKRVEPSLELKGLEMNDLEERDSRDDELELLLLGPRHECWPPMSTGIRDEVCRGLLLPERNGSD